MPLSMPLYAADDASVTLLSRYDAADVADAARRRF